VLREVGRNPRADAEAIARGVRRELGSISRQSVYNVLTVLTERGILRRIQPADSPARWFSRLIGWLRRSRGAGRGDSGLTG